MAGMMSAAMRAPLTGAVFAAELTGRIDILPGTIAAAVAGYALAVLVLRRSILTEKIARRGRHLSQEYGVDPLALSRVGEIMTPDPETLEADMPVAAALAFFQREARHRSYPVVDAAGRPIGLVSRSDALRWRGSEAQPGATLADVATDRSLNVAASDMPANLAADLMIAEEIGRLPVIAPIDGRLVGILARRDLLQARAGAHRDESERRRFMGFSRRSRAAS
jgi:CBS domain-containing protein